MKLKRLFFLHMFSYNLEEINQTLQRGQILETHHILAFFLKCSAAEGKLSESQCQKKKTPLVIEQVPLSLSLTLIQLSIKLTFLHKYYKCSLHNLNLNVSEVKDNIETDNSYLSSRLFYLNSQLNTRQNCRNEIYFIYSCLQHRLQIQ